MAADASVPAGESLDVDALYRTQMRPLYAYIYSKVGNREAAEDITADVFIKALTHLDLTREERSIIAWLFRVARNAVNDYWREGHGAPVILFEEARLERRQETRPDSAREAQTAAQARAVLAALPDTYRMVLTCRLLDGLSVVETAQRMGTTTGNVKVMQHRALKYAAGCRASADAGRVTRRRHGRNVPRGVVPTATGQSRPA
jgi:RNA polymerase sigma-70 factor (ECF subfamily)